MHEEEDGQGETPEELFSEGAGTWGWGLSPGALIRMEYKAGQQQVQMNQGTSNYWPVMLTTTAERYPEKDLEEKKAQLYMPLVRDFQAYGFCLG